MKTSILEGNESTSQCPSFFEWFQDLLVIFWSFLRVWKYESLCLRFLIDFRLLFAMLWSFYLKFYIKRYENFTFSSQNDMKTSIFKVRIHSVPGFWLILGDFSEVFSLNSILNDAKTSLLMILRHVLVLPQNRHIYTTYSISNPNMEVIVIQRQHLYLGKLRLKI